MDAHLDPAPTPPAATSTEPSAAHASDNPVRDRFDEAVAKLDGKPGVVDIAFARVGDRYGWVITMPETCDTSVVVKTSTVSGDIRARYDRAHGTITVGVDGHKLCYEAAVTIEDAPFGVTVER